MEREPLRTSSSAPVSVQNFIDTAPLSRRQRLIVFLTFLVVVADGMDLSIVSHLFPRLIAEWDISIAQVTLTVILGIVAMGIGALISGPAADRLGRIPVLMAGFVLFNVTTAALGLTGSIEAFIVLRILASVGLGAVLPVAMTLVADWVPAARRAQMVAIAFSGAALGSIIGAYLAATLIPAFGWQTMVIVAGLFPLLIAPFYLRLVPEPPATLIKRGRPAAEVERSLSVIGAESENVDTTIVTSQDAAKKNVFKVVFSKSLAISTALIWLLTLVTQALLILVLQYLPILLQQPDPGPGLSTAQSGVIVAMWGWGTLVGLVLISFALKWFDRFLTGAVAGLLTIVGLLVIALGNFEFFGLMIALLLTGIAFAALPSVTNAITTIAYPAEARATGVGTASFLGRIGGLTGGLTGGLLIGAGFTLQTIFAVITVPTAITLAAFLAMRSEVRRRTRLSQND
jgi:AAHS family 4-hydroxybenzoate transporter-like MFS transporter